VTESTPRRSPRSSFYSRFLRRFAAVLSGCLILSVGLWLGAAHAAETDSETEVAKERFKEGVKHYDQREYDKARLAFLQAYLLKPHPTVLLNLAQCELRSGRPAEAADHFAKYIRENPNAEALGHARAGFEDARQRVAELNVEVTAPGATVIVDGTEVGRSPLPGVLYLMPGRHAIGARKGSVSDSGSLDAVAGQRVYVTLDVRDTNSSGSPIVTTDERSPSPLVARASVSSEAPVDSTRSQGFFSWLSDSPAAIATVSVAGLALGTSAVLAAFANDRYASAKDVKNEIMGALEENVDSGVLISTAVPCGEDGVANRPEWVDSRVDPDEAQDLRGDFANACSLFTERSDSGDRLKTLSLVSLGIGAVATVGTIVWYFSDTAGDEDAATEGRHPSPAKARASLTPILSHETQGLWLNIAF
jgi:hypothetical protein